MDPFTADDHVHMAQALRLAEKGRYTAHPNPVVGCVLVRDGAVIGSGWHQKAGAAHAEINALGNADKSVTGGTAYVTLEPCSHHGKTPPCADALIEAGVAEVVIAMQDPNPMVAGRGIEKLKLAGIRVRSGLMATSAAALNRGFLQRVAEKRPLLRLKLACSIDGAIAMHSGESQWITGAAARADVQRLRARSGAIMTGIGTVLADDPSLNVRSDEIETLGLQPLRVVLDSSLRMPSQATMLSIAGQTLVCCGDNAKQKSLPGAEAEVMAFSERDGLVDVAAVLDELGRREINELLVEAGPSLSGNLLSLNLVDELVIYQAPHIMGSETQRLVATPTWTALADRAELDITDRRRVGDDLRITATIRATQRD